MATLKSHISALIEAAEPGQIWVPTDFAQLGCGLRALCNFALAIREKPAWRRSHDGS